MPLKECRLPAKTPSKVDFVRALPPSLSAKEVIAKAKAKGIKITAAYVYVIRSQGGIKKRGKPGPKPRSAAGDAGIDRQFIGLALEIGFGRAQQLLDDARARIRHAIG
jgi:hypothetical protein